MRIAFAFVMLFCISIFNATCLARPMRRSSTSECIASAPIILEADAGAFEFENIPEGKSIRISQNEFFCRWREYTIRKILRNQHKAQIRIGEKLHLSHFGTSCLPKTLEIDRHRNSLIVKDVETGSIEKLAIDRKSLKVILFLDTKLDGTCHHWKNSDAEIYSASLEKLCTSTKIPNSLTQSPSPVPCPAPSPAPGKATKAKN